MIKKYPKKVNYFPAIGRRKRAVARVRLFTVKGETVVNDQPIGKYFSGAVFKNLYLEPFKVCDVVDKYYATVKVFGSGKAGQLGAVTLGLSRALIKVNPANRLILKKKGLLTRDPRERQRRMVGMGGKSRRKKQSPKR